MLWMFPAWAREANDPKACIQAVQDKDLVAASKYLQPLVDKENVVAQFQLDLMPADGRGVPQNTESAARLFRTAAEKDYALVQASLKILHAFGSGVPQSDVESAKWLHKVAEQGYGPAKGLLDNGLKLQRA
jgi:TPR repeat protein